MNCEACEHRSWTELKPKKIIDNHEKGAEKTEFANVTDEWHEDVEGEEGDMSV